MSKDCCGHSWRVRLDKQETLTPPRAPGLTSGEGVRECPPWCIIVGATGTVHQFFCILHSKFLIFIFSCQPKNIIRLLKTNIKKKTASIKCVTHIEKYFCNLLGYFVEKAYLVHFERITFKLVWLRITDEGSLPEIHKWFMLLIKSDFKWCIHFSRRLF